MTIRGLRRSTRPSTAIRKQKENGETESFLKCRNKGIFINLWLKLNLNQSCHHSYSNDPETKRNIRPVRMV